MNTIKFKRTPELNERVRGFLNEKLAQYEVDCQRVYITRVHDLIDLNVVFSQDLYDLGGDTLEWGNVQVHDQGLTDIFTEHQTFEKEYLFGKLSVQEVEKLMEDLLYEATRHWDYLAIVS